MALYLHPKTNAADAAIHAFRNGARLVSVDGRVRVVPGRDPRQYEKALKARTLRRMAESLRQ